MLGSTPSLPLRIRTELIQIKLWFFFMLSIRRTWLSASTTINHHNFGLKQIILDVLGIHLYKPMHSTMEGVLINTKYYIAVWDLSSKFERCNTSRTTVFFINNLYRERAKHRYLQLLLYITSDR